MFFENDVDVMKEFWDRINLEIKSQDHGYVSLLSIPSIILC